jgi:hypothetical protein
MKKSVKGRDAQKCIKKRQIMAWLSEFKAVLKAWKKTSPRSGGGAIPEG